MGEGKRLVELFDPSGGLTVDELSPVLLKIFQRYCVFEK